MRDAGSLGSADDFPVPDLAAWTAKVERELRGRTLDDLAWEVAETALPPLATRHDIEDLPHLADAPRSWLGTDGPWRIRELIVAPDPERAACEAREALADGADEIELCCDELVRDAREPGEDELEPGVSGIAIHGLDDLRAAVDGIDLGATHVGISAGEGAVPVLAYLLAVADERGVERARLRGEVDFDPIARLTLRQAGVDPDDEQVIVSRRTGVTHVFDEAAALVRACAATCPGVRPLAVDGQIYHLVGAPPELEVAATLAAAATTARELGQRGIDFDGFAAAATLHVQVGHEILTEIAKLRALRLLWTKLAHACGARDEATYRPPLHCVTSGRSRTYRYDLRTNLLRTGLQAFAAVAGGCDALAVVPFDEDPAHQDAATRRLARHQQLLLRDESHLGRVADPAGGSFAIDRLTDLLARRAWLLLVGIERQGGLLATLEDGSLDSLASLAAGARLQALEAGERVLVGITEFVDEALEGAHEHDDDAFYDGLEALAQRLDERLEGRDAVAVQRALGAIGDAGALDAMVAAARAGATTGELARASWPDGGGFQHRFGPIAIADGEEFERRRHERESEDDDA